MEEQQAIKYINDLKYPIQERVILHDVSFVDEAHNKAMKIERLQSKAPPFRRPTPIEESASDVRVQSSPAMVDRPPVHQSTNTSASTPLTTIIVAAKNKENPYAKPVIGKCYKCGVPEHRSNECFKRKQVNIADYRDEGEWVAIEEASDSDFVEEYGDHVSRVVQILLCNQNFPGTT